MSRGEHSQEKKINIPILIFRIISIIIILVCLWKIYEWYKENQSTSQMTEEIKQIAGVTEKIEVRKGKKYKTLDLDFQELKRKNSETVAWIKMENTNIDYPIVQAEDNSFYLTHSFDKSYNGAGWIFADYRNNFENLDQNTIIYGHNRKDSSMFGSLSRLNGREWFDTEENKYISFSTPKEKMVWEIFSIYTIEPEEYYLTNNFQSTETFQTFINTLKNRSARDFNVEVGTNDKILTLSTCSGTGVNRFVVHAKKIDLTDNVDVYEKVQTQEVE